MHPPDTYRWVSVRADGERIIICERLTAIEVERLFLAMEREPSETKFVFEREPRDH